jgi:hypothetical protein
MDDRTGIFGWTTGRGGVPYFRIHEPLRVLAASGQRALHGPQLDDDVLSTVDTVLVDKLWDSEASVAWQRLAKLGSHRLVIDVDDWVWAPDWAPMKAGWTPEALNQLYTNIRAAHVVTTPSTVIAEHLTRYNPNVWWVPNTIPAWLLDNSIRSGGVDFDGGPSPALVYEGSPSHQRDWTHSSAGKQMWHFLREHPDWNVYWYGTEPSGLPAAFPGRIQVSPWHQSVDDHLHRMREETVHGDVMIGPLRDTPFNRGKSGLRAVVASALGIVPVLPDMPGYRPFIEDGLTGRLIKSGQTLRRVLADVAAEPEWRLAAAAAARTTAQQWTTEAAIGSWVEAWNSR